MLFSGSFHSDRAKRHREDKHNKHIKSLRLIYHYIFFSLPQYHPSESSKFQFSPSFDAHTILQERHIYLAKAIQVQVQDSSSHIST